MYYNLQGAVILTPGEMQDILNGKFTSVPDMTATSLRRIWPPHTLRRLTAALVKTLQTLSKLRLIRVCGQKIETCTSVHLGLAQEARI